MDPGCWIQDVACPKLLKTLVIMKIVVPVVVVTASIGTGAHREDPSWCWHLVIDTAKGGRQFVRQRPGDNHQVRCERAKTTPKRSMSYRGGEVHHFNGTTRQTREICFTFYNFSKFVLLRTFSIGQKWSTKLSFVLTVKHLNFWGWILLTC